MEGAQPRSSCRAWGCGPPVSQSLHGPEAPEGSLLRWRAAAAEGAPSRRQATVICLKCHRCRQVKGCHPQEDPRSRGQHLLCGFSPVQAAGFGLLDLSPPRSALRPPLGPQRTPPPSKRAPQSVSCAIPVSPPPGRPSALSSPGPRGPAASNRVFSSRKCPFASAKLSP